MANFWVTFRIADIRVGLRDYEDRYQDLIDALQSAATIWWAEPTSYAAFESAKEIDELAELSKAAIAPAHDLFLIPAMDKQSAVICGKNDDADIFRLMPYLRAV